jgi:hypothetical protein
LKPAHTVQAFGHYAQGAGLLLMLKPEWLLQPLGMAAPSDNWIHVLGALAFVLGSYYVAMARAQALAFFYATLWGRGLFALLCLGLVMSARAPQPLLLFGAIDLLGAGWTAWALRRAQTEEETPA